jgi:hypothetical protein
MALVAFVESRRQMAAGGAGSAVPVIGHVTNNITTTTNNININFTLNSFGKEDTEHISHDDIVNCTRDPVEGCQKLILKIHYEHPSNRNFSLGTGPFMDVHRAGRWEKMPKKVAMAQIMTTPLTLMADSSFEKTQRMQRVDDLYNAVVVEKTPKVMRDMLLRTEATILNAQQKYPQPQLEGGGVQ